MRRLNLRTTVCYSRDGGVRSVFGLIEAVATRGRSVAFKGLGMDSLVKYRSTPHSCPIRNGCRIRKSALERHQIPESVSASLTRQVDRVEWPARRQGMAEVAVGLLEGKPDGRGEIDARWQLGDEGAADGHFCFSTPVAERADSWGLESRCGGAKSKRGSPAPTGWSSTWITARNAEAIAGNSCPAWWPWPTGKNRLLGWSITLQKESEPRKTRKARKEKEVANLGLPSGA